MILWTIKLVGMVRKAIAGRKYPSQLAWAVAFGVLLGIVPHGNLLAVALLIVVLSLRLNHAMAMLTAVGVTFLATKLDPVSHSVGESLLNRDGFSLFAMKAWAFPMVPWTDLNNTVVLGSFTIGLIALLPIFLVSYPVFRWLAPKPESEEQAEASTEPRHDRSSSGEITYVDHGQSGVPTRRNDPQPAPRTLQTETANGEKIHFVEIQRTDAAHAAPTTRKPTTRETSNELNQTVETRIDVIRVNESSDATTAQAGVRNVADFKVTAPKVTPQKVTPQKVTDTEAQPMDEALNYLLRQLRDSQQRNVA